MAYFPFMTEVSDKDILVVGGGRSAFHKVRAFCGFGAHLTVIAENISPDIIKVSGEFAMVRKPFEITDLEGRDIVIASTDGRSPLLAGRPRTQGSDHSAGPRTHRNDRCHPL